MRSILYLITKFLGDIFAVSKGRTGKRVARRVAGRVTGKMLNKFFR